MMSHTDPTFRALLLALAEPDPPDLSVLPALADWLEEHGDEERAAQVRHVAKLVRILSPVRNVATPARRVLALFPEGPRWRLQSVHERDGKHGLIVILRGPHYNAFLTPAEAKAASASPLGYSLPVVGPLWPDPIPA